MKKAVVEAWLSGLRSGEFKQHRGRVCNDANSNLKKADAFCCIGVAAVVNNIPKQEDVDTWDCAHFVGIDTRTEKEYENEDGTIRKTSDYTRLVEMNDAERKTFPEIADWIEKNILPNATVE